MRQIADDEDLRVARQSELRANRDAAAFLQLCSGVPRQHLAKGGSANTGGPDDGPRR